MIRGGCLCGGVRFEISNVVGPFELCHCNRCRKATGSAFMPGLGVHRENFTWLSGRELVKTFETPLLETPPAYRTSFCSVCGSPAPDPESDANWFEVPAGLLDDDPVIRPDKHIYVENKADWYKITDQLPQLNKQELTKSRQKDKG